jgi:hypothetical protein
MLVPIRRHSSDFMILYGCDLKMVFVEKYVPRFSDLCVRGKMVDKK